MIAAAAGRWQRLRTGMPSWEFPKIRGLGFRVQRLGLRVQLGFRVQGSVMDEVSQNIEFYGLRACDCASGRVGFVEMSLPTWCFQL